jgi:hypothetical protein
MTETDNKIMLGYHAAMAAMQAVGMKQETPMQEDEFTTDGWLAARGNISERLANKELASKVDSGEFSVRDAIVNGKSRKVYRKVNSQPQIKVAPR